MNNPLKIGIDVAEDAGPVLEFLASHGHDVGSVRAALLYDDAPPDMRFLCVGCTDPAAVWSMAEAMRVAFHRAPRLIELTNKVSLIRGPLGTVIVVFLEIVAIESPPC